MKFEQPLWLLVGVIAGAALLWRYRRFDRQQAALLTKFIASRLKEQLTQSFSPRRRMIKRGLFLAATMCLFIALARPQAGFRWEETQRKGLEILFAVDTSKSMLAQDVKPNRLTRAKLAVEDLLGKLHGDGVGLIAFAGSSFLQCPITLDYDAFRDSLAALDTGVIPKGGTDVAAAIREAQAAFKTRPASDRILILLTDGEDLEGEAITAARSAAGEGVKIFAVGVGSAKGELVPVPSGNGGTEFMKDENGQFVKSHLDEHTLKQIAGVTGGMYQPLGQQSQGLTAIYDQGLKAFTRHELTSRQHKVYLERFQWPLLAALGLLVAEFLVSTRRRVGPASRLTPNPVLNPLATGRVAETSDRGAAGPAAGIAALVFALVVFPASGHASPGSAEQAYQKGDYAAAAKDYAASAQKQPARAELQFNLGAADYKTGEFAAAEKSFQSALKTEQLPVQQSAYYNLGNAQYRSGQKTEQSNPQQTIKRWESAVQSYDAALQLKAGDADAKYNRDLVQRKLDELKKQQRQNQKQNQDQQQNQQNQASQSKSDQNQDQNQKDQQSQANQNKSGQPKQDSKPDQNQRAGKGNDQDKSQDRKHQAGSDQSQPKQPDADKQSQRPASAGKDQKSPAQQANNGLPSEPKQPSKGTPEANAKPDEAQPENEPAQFSERREPGQMTKEEARNLLDSLKGEERKVTVGQMARGAAPKEDNKPLRDW